MRLRDGIRAAAPQLLATRYHILVATRQDSKGEWSQPKAECPIWSSPRRIGPAVLGSRRAA